MDARHRHRRSDCRVGAGLDRRCKRGVDVMGIYITTPRDEYFEYKHIVSANQTAEFRDDGVHGSLYNLQLTILDHAKPVVNLQGRVVHETVLAIIDQSTKYHLRLVKDAVDARLEGM